MSAAEPQAAQRFGFTLVEMLVVVALTVLLMSIVAEVFVLASGTLSTLRAVSEANQKYRAIESQLRLDLVNRSVRVVQPPMEKRRGWLPGPDGQPGAAGFDDDGNGVVDDVSEFGPGPGPDGIPGNADDSDDIPVEFMVPVGLDPSQNLGYFMIEENSPADDQGEDTDDVLAFTVRLTVASKPSGMGPGPGPDGIFGTADDLPGTAAYFGQGVPGGSQEAEIIYFLRKGTLYRRVLLVGVPQPDASSFIVGASWYAQFDVSARPPLTPNGVPIVNKLGDLTYRSTRFGHRPPLNYVSDQTGVATMVPPIPAAGAGLEADFPADPLFLATGYSAQALSFADSGNLLHNIIDHNNNYGIVLARELWFGRPTLRETSNPNFDHPTWPSLRPPTQLSRLWANPNDQFSPPLNPEYLNSASPRYFENLDLTATRPAEDAVMTDVLSFDVKVLDLDATAVPAAVYSGVPPTGAFVDLGKFTNPLATDASYAIPGPYPSSGTPYGFLGIDPTVASALFGLPPAFFAYPRAGVWPPERPLPPFNWFPEPVAAFPAPGMGGYRRGFAMPFGAILPNGLLNNATNNPSFSAWVIPPGSSVLPQGMLRAPAALNRTYDTWCSAYTRPTQQFNDLNSNGVQNGGEPSVLPVAPPYIVPLRAIQIKIRFVDPDTQLTRELTIVQELQ